MKPERFKEIASIMREYGIASVRMGNHEFKLQMDPEASRVAFPNDVPPERSSSQVLEEVEEGPIEHKIEQLKSLMKLGDHELVDELFPDHTAASSEEESA